MRRLIGSENDCVRRLSTQTATNPRSARAGVRMVRAVCRRLFG